MSTSQKWYGALFSSSCHFPDLFPLCFPYESILMSDSLGTRRAGARTLPSYGLLVRLEYPMHFTITCFNVKTPSKIFLTFRRSYTSVKGSVRAGSHRSYHSMAERIIKRVLYARASHSHRIRSYCGWRSENWYYRRPLEANEPCSVVYVSCTASIGLIYTG